MATNATTFLEMLLENPADEEDLLLWWDEARAFLAQRARLSMSFLHVLGRGHYIAVLGFPLPGGWTLIREDRRWRELEQTRPPARVTERQGRPWRREGNPREITTTELARLLAEREAGRRDVVVIDTLSEASYAEAHIPGSISLPGRALTEDAVALTLGPDRDRTVVVYCSGYG